MIVLGSLVPALFTDATENVCTSHDTLLGTGHSTYVPVTMVWECGKGRVEKGSESSYNSV